MSIQTPDDNTFTRMPEFIEADHRSRRTEDPEKIGQPYAVTTGFMFNRHRIMLPREYIEGKTVLDIGSCYAATGAWCLDNGAKHYTGLEPQHKFVIDSSAMLGKYYSKDKFDIIEQPLDTFEPDRKWDVVVASGVLYGMFDQHQCVKKITSLASETLIVESQHPFAGGKLLFAFPPSPEWLRDRMKNLNVIQIVENWPMMIDAERDANFVYAGSFSSRYALAVLCKSNGWDYDDVLYDRAEKEMPEYYDVSTPTGKRFMAKFYPSDVRVDTFTDVYQDPTAKRVKWSGNSTSQ
jgi:predicted nicotinamide N-methyase